jgi:uncharacterized protein (TIGR02145 family)
MSGTFTDSRDGQTYKTVKIGNQTWMAQNMNYRTEKRSCCYENNPDNCKKYGKLYDWNTANVACPKGWHLPSKGEWTKWITMVGSLRAGKTLKSKSGWNESGNGTDDYGFSALPGGLLYSGGDFLNADGERYRDGFKFRGDGRGKESHGRQPNYSIGTDTHSPMFFFSKSKFTPILKTIFPRPVQGIAYSLLSICASAASAVPSNLNSKQ